MVVRLGGRGGVLFGAATTGDRMSSAPAAALPCAPVPLRVRVGIKVVTPHCVVAIGVINLLAGRHGDLVIEESPDIGEPDVVLYDVIGLHEGDGCDLDRWLAHPSPPVIAITRELRPDLGAAALARGAAAAVSLGASVADFVEVIEAAVTGMAPGGRAVTRAQDGTTPGRADGLTQREADVLGMIVQGMTNPQIATAACVSINSVKSYIRSAYRKMGVTTRSQAVGWGVRHGFPLKTEAR